MLLSGQPCCPEKGQVPTCVLVPSAPASGRSSESYPSLRCVPLAHAAVAQVRSCRRGMCIWCLMTKPLGLAAVTAVPSTAQLEQGWIPLPLTQTQCPNPFAYPVRKNPVGEMTSYCCFSFCFLITGEGRHDLMTIGGCHFCFW